MLNAKLKIRRIHYDSSRVGPTSSCLFQNMLNDHLRAQKFEQNLICKW